MNNGVNLRIKVKYFKNKCVDLSGFDMIERKDDGIFLKLTKNDIIIFTVKTAQDVWHCNRRQRHCSSDLNFTPCSVMSLYDC